MTDRKLLNSLAKLGFPMLEPVEEIDVYETLAEVVKSRDTRLWEGFPVLLANVAENYPFSFERVEQLLTQKELREQFHQLVLLSLAVYAAYQLTFSWSNQLKKNLSNKDKALIKSWRIKLVNNQDLVWKDVRFDPERLKNMFELYFEHSAEKSRRRKEKYEEFSLEYSLSQVFSPKQKELFKKRLEGLPLTKTEQEYYSRTVKKKVVALANPELHALSRRLLEQ
ncbi:MAG: hypothetical protein V3R44_00865 [bacterium]